MKFLYIELTLTGLTVFIFGNNNNLAFGKCCTDSFPDRCREEAWSVCAGDKPPALRILFCNVWIFQKAKLLPLLQVYYATDIKAIIQEIAMYFMAGNSADFRLSKIAGCFRVNS